MTRNRCILIIDDEEDIREVTQLTLELEGGWDVLTASSGMEGIALAERERPDAILLDVMMPDMDGIATIGGLKDNPQTRSIPVLFLTAKGQSDALEEWLELGVTATISKPFNPLQLVSQIRQILRWN
ncbi:MAG: response regulator [Cyanobacteria bacterium SID2]|nr:response regulator [Cyanobacteria bacterium SID2]MBP0004840.1 response regulator [Cyanobacteria bacterium SBC]